MARKKKHEEHENHERWLVSYADFITLLFAFFVVMYSISSVNEGKFKVLSNAMVAAFHTPAKSLAPIQVGKMVRSPQEPLQEVMNAPTPPVLTPISISLPMPTAANVEPMRVDGTASENGERNPREAGHSDSAGVAVPIPPGDAARKQVETIANQVETALKALIQAGKVRVRHSKLWLEVEINTSILFASGSGQLTRDAQPVLEKLGAVLAPLPNFVHVEGFTDNHPISTLVYPSNWELSAGRAATVVRLFAGYGVAPQRMTSIGYGEYRPIADNTSVAGRAANRRVVVVVLADPITANDAGRADDLDGRRGEEKAGDDHVFAPKESAVGSGGGVAVRGAGLSPGRLSP